MSGCGFFVASLTLHYVENIRLTGGSSIYEGQVEVFINGQWGTVCSDGIGTNEAETLCQSLGFGPFQSISNNFIGNATNIPLVISDLRCSEDYDHFMKCTFNHSSPMCSVVGNLGLKCYRKYTLHTYVCQCKIETGTERIEAPPSYVINAMLNTKTLKLCYN